MQQEKDFIALWVLWSNACECSSSTSSAHMNAIPTVPATFMLLNCFSKLPPLSFHSVLLIFFFFQQKINWIWHDLPSFLGWLVLLLFTFSSCSEKFFLFFFPFTSPFLEFLYHSCLFCKLIPMLHLTFHSPSRGCKRWGFCWWTETLASSLLLILLDSAYLRCIYTSDYAISS